MPIPNALTPLLGRGSELQELDRLLGTTRLLTITGAGGCGKTRLALELAHRVSAKFAEGAVWVDLASVSDAELIPQQILGAIGEREVAGRDDLQVVLDALRDGSVLVVLDNCEHLVDACASAAETILRACPRTTIVTTTREALGVTGEQTWLVPPLCEGDGMQLFVDRARAVSPSFTLNDGNRAAIAHICTRLDGIPLAIELAAARVKVLSVEGVASRLDDAFRLLTSGARTLPRHRTIRETIEWSFRLLSEDEQTLLRRLAVFAGSFTLAAAETICGDERIDAFAHLAALVDKSLVLWTEGRYRLLETVRQFAAEKLRHSDDRDAIREKHARFYYQLVERSERKIYAGAVDPPTLQRIDEEIGNIRAVFDWAEQDPSRSEIELRLLWALHWYWFARGHFHEARRLIGAGLTRASSADPVVRARAIVASGNAAVWQADWKAIRPSIDDAVGVLRGSNNLRALANALLLLGTAHAFAERDHGAARRVFEEAEDVARRNGRNVALALTLYWSGLAAQVRGDLAGARAQFEEALQIGTDIDNRPAIAHSCTVLGDVALREKRFDEALRLFRRALDIHVEVGDRWGLTQVIEGVALTLVHIGDPEVGTRLLAGASAAWLQLGARGARHASAEADERIRRALGDERLRRAVASGAAMAYEDLVALAREHAAPQRANAPGQTGLSVLHDQSGAPMLRVRALGGLEIYRGEEKMNANAQSARARELLLYLLCHPSGSTKEQIGAALWPDAEPAKLRNNFHVTVHRLRKTLGATKWIVANGETYAIDREAGIDFDAEKFEREAKAALRTLDPAHLEQAAALYRGDFFASAASSDWHLSVRDRLRDLYAETLRNLGRARMAARDFRAAAEVYRKLVDLDPLDEQACRNLMTCLGNEGDATGASLAYRHLVASLRREVDAAPDPATVKLYARITGG